MSVVWSSAQPGRLAELNSIYLDDQDRYVVSLIVGYTDDDLEGDEELPPEPIERAKLAAKWALDLTRDEGAYGTQWFVYDRKTKTMHQIEQREFDGDFDRAWSVEGLDDDFDPKAAQEHGL